MDFPLNVEQGLASHPGANVDTALASFSATLAMRHGFGVALLKAGASALKARSGTFMARKKAFFLDLTEHFHLQ
jgi:hypothetical protein